MTGRTLFIDGSWEGPGAAGTIPVVDPSTGESYREIARGQAEDGDRAVASARHAFEGLWRRVSPVERGRILARWSALVMRDHERLAQEECRDVGKPIGQARRDITACARYLEFYAGSADKLHGETIPYEPGYTVLAVREPFGVTGHIIP